MVRKHGHLSLELSLQYRMGLLNAWFNNLECKKVITSEIKNYILEVLKVDIHTRKNGEHGVGISMSILDF